MIAGAKHAACTVEMASVSRQVDVAVVDEIQMVADPSRGHSFTRAILGIPAHTLHVCGDPASLPLLRQLMQDTGKHPTISLRFTRAKRRFVSGPPQGTPVKAVFSGSTIVPPCARRQGKLACAQSIHHESVEGPPAHAFAGDVLEVLQYERLLPLKAEKAAVGTLEGVRKGDCLVAFSRREVHSTKRALESWGALKCCVVYGALPAESRTQQVRPSVITAQTRSLRSGTKPISQC